MLYGSAEQLILATVVTAELRNGGEVGVSSLGVEEGDEGMMICCPLTELVSV
mgnify:FL=1